MRALRPISLFFAVFCSVSWSANAQTSPNRAGQGTTELAWLVSEKRPLSDSTSQATPPSPPTERRAPVSFALHRQADAVLLHLKDKRNYISLRISSPTGQEVQSITQTNLSGGFYELALPSRSANPGLYLLKLIVNHEVITFSTTL